MVSIYLMFFFALKGSKNFLSSRLIKICKTICLDYKIKNALTINLEQAIFRFGNFNWRPEPSYCSS